jgi:hypothetical protein
VVARERERRLGIGAQEGEVDDPWDAGGERGVDGRLCSSTRSAASPAGIKKTVSAPANASRISASAP